MATKRNHTRNSERAEDSQDLQTSVSNRSDLRSAPSPHHGGSPIEHQSAGEVQANDNDRKALPPIAKAAPVLGRSILKVRQLLKRKQSGSHSSATRNVSASSKLQSVTPGNQTGPGQASNVQVITPNPDEITSIRNNVVRKPTPQKRRSPYSTTNKDNKNPIQTAKRLRAMLRPAPTRKKMKTPSETPAATRNHVDNEAGNLEDINLSIGNIAPREGVPDSTEEFDGPATTPPTLQRLSPQKSTESRTRSTAEKGMSPAPIFISEETERVGGLSSSTAKPSSPPNVIPQKGGQSPVPLAKEKLPHRTTTLPIDNTTTRKIITSPPSGFGPSHINHRSRSPLPSPPPELKHDSRAQVPAISTPENTTPISFETPVPQSSTIPDRPRTPSRLPTPPSPRVPRKKHIGKQAIPPPSTPFVDPSLNNPRTERDQRSVQHHSIERSESRELHQATTDEQRDTGERSEPNFTNERVPTPSTGRTPQRMNHGSVYIRPVLNNLQEQGLIHFIQVYRNLATRRRQGDVEESKDGLSQAKSEQDRWHISILHEIAASLNKTMSEEKYEPVELSVLSRTEALDGVFIETIASPNRNKLFPYDCIYHTSSDGLHTTGLVLGSESDYDFTGTAVLVLDWFEDYKGHGQTFHMGNIRHDFTKLHALKEMIEPKSELASTLSTIMRGNPQNKLDLFQETRRKPLPDRQLVLRSGNVDVAARYLKELRHRKVLNVQQADIVECSLITCDAWKTVPRSQVAQLNRILLVSGVPGCGKTYTAVHMIATFLLYFNPEYVKSYTVPYWLGSVLVLTKTNKALDVFLDRLEYVSMPDAERNGWCKRPIPCFCKHSASYLSREDCDTRIRRGQTDDPNMIKDVPVILSTFGNLQNLSRHLVQSFGSYEEVLRWFAQTVKAVVIDEGSQSVALDILSFLMLFPTFDGTIIITGDPEQMGPVVLTNMQEARSYLSRSLFTDLRESRSSSGYMVPHAEMLIQYRMHMDIMNLANDISYRGRMVYGPPLGYHDRMKLPQEAVVELQRGSLVRVDLGPVVAYTTSNAPTNLFQCRDFRNSDELQVAFAVASAAISTGKYHPRDIIFLSPYTKQCSAMKRLCAQEDLNIGVHTVASYQGQEASLIIYSLVRRTGSGTGFLDRKEMMSVAITRASHGLVVIGDLTYLSTSIQTTSIWQHFIQSIRNRRHRVRPAEELLRMRRN